MFQENILEKADKAPRRHRTALHQFQNVPRGKMPSAVPGIYLVSFGNGDVEAQPVALDAFPMHFGSFWAASGGDRVIRQEIIALHRLHAHVVCRPRKLRSHVRANGSEDLGWIFLGLRNRREKKEPQTSLATRHYSFMMAGFD